MEGNKKIRRVRYVCILFFVIITGLFLILANIENKRDLGESVNLSESIDLKPDVYGYMDVYGEPYLFAENDSDDAKLYFIWDIYEQISIADLPLDLVEEISLATYEKPLRIYAKTKNITDEIKDIAIEVYNEGNEEGTEDITSEGFYEWFGTFYLDARYTFKNTILFYFIAIISSVIAFIIVIVHLFHERKIKRVINSLNYNTANLISLELESSKTICYEKHNIFLTENYVIYLGGDMFIIKYEDISWIYFIDIKQNGFTTSRRIYIIDKDNKRNIILVPPIGKDKNIHIKIIDQISSRNLDMLVGFTKENKKEMKSRKQN